MFTLYFLLGVCFYLYALTQVPEHQPTFLDFSIEVIVAGLFWPFITLYVITRHW